MESISVIVCTRNRPVFLRRLFDSLMAADAEGSVEIVVVDNASSDETAEAIQAVQNTSTIPIVTAFEPRIGVGFARNTGVAQSSGRIVAFTDDDCICPPNFLTELRRLFEDQTIAYGAGCMLPFDSADVGDFNVFSNVERVTAGAYLTGGFISGGCLAFRREVFDAVGGFDEDFGAGARWRCEDVDFCQRVSRAGFVGLRYPQWFVYHAHGRRTPDVVEAQWKANVRARGAYCAKHAFLGDRRHGAALWRCLLGAARGEREPRLDVEGAATYLIARLGKRAKALADRAPNELRSSPS